jgi:hypothetical protein
MRNVLDKSVEKIKTHILYSTLLFFFFFENRAVCEIMSKNMVEPEGVTNDVIIWRIRVTCWTSKVTCTHANAHTHALGHMHTHTHTNM